MELVDVSAVLSSRSSETRKDVPIVITDLMMAVKEQQISIPTQVGTASVLVGTAKMSGESEIINSDFPFALVTSERQKMEDQGPDNFQILLRIFTKDPTVSQKLESLNVVAKHSQSESLLFMDKKSAAESILASELPEALQSKISPFDRSGTWFCMRYGLINLRVADKLDTSQSKGVINAEEMLSIGIN